MGLSHAQLDALMSPINPKRVKQFGNSAGSKAGLSYVEAFDIKASLIRIFGFGGFSVEVIDSKILMFVLAETHPWHVDRQGKPKTPQVLAQSTVRLTIPSIEATYVETAIGSNSGFDLGDAADNAIKSAASDALKRCATFLGSQFGLSLYDKDHQAEEVVKVLIEQEQADLYREVIEQRQGKRAEQVAATQAVIDQATGAEE